MSKEGYLILHHEGTTGSRSDVIYYFVLGAGALQYYTRRGGLLVSHLPLSGYKIKITGLQNQDECRHSFILRRQKTDIVQGKLVRSKQEHITRLSASSLDECTHWANSIYSWQRQYWKDPVHHREYPTPEAKDVYFQTQYERLQLQLMTKSRLKPEPSVFWKVLRYPYAKKRSAKATNIVVDIPLPLLSMTTTSTDSSVSPPARKADIAGSCA